MKKAYLFDFDGTLVDSMPTYVRSMLRILDENGIEYGDDIVVGSKVVRFAYTLKIWRFKGYVICMAKLLAQDVLEINRLVAF